MSCPGCGHPNFAGTSYCEQCGRELAPMRPPSAAAPPSGPYGAPPPFPNQPPPSWNGPTNGYPPPPMNPFAPPQGGFSGPMYDGPTRTSGLAIAGLVLAFFCGLLGLILSIMAYNETKSNPEVGGEGLAIAGIIIASANMLLGIVISLAS